jgi:hypothetical protein
MGTIAGLSVPSGSGGRHGGRYGPWKASDDDLFVVGASSTTVSMYRSADGGDTWGSAVTTTAGGAVAAIDVAQSGDTLYVAWITGGYADGMNTLRDIEYQEFNMATNAWSGSVDVVDSPNVTDIAGLAFEVAVARRSSDSVILYSGPRHTDMGNSFLGVSYARGTAGSWTNTGIAVAGNTGGVNWEPGAAVIGSQAGECHFVWERSTSSFAIEARTLDASNSLSTMVNQGSGVFVGNSACVAYDDGGTWRIVVGQRPGTAIDLYIWGEDASNDISVTSGNADITVSNVAETIQPALAVDNTDQFFVFYREAASDDLWYADDDDPTSAFANTGTSLATSTANVLILGANYYNNGADVIGVIWDDNGTKTYTELSLGGAAASLLHRRRPLRSLIVR